MPGVSNKLHKRIRDEKESKGRKRVPADLVRLRAQNDRAAAVDDAHAGLPHSFHNPLFGKVKLDVDRNRVEFDVGGGNIIYATLLGDDGSNDGARRVSLRSRSGYLVVRPIVSNAVDVSAEEV